MNTRSIFEMFTTLTDPDHSLALVIQKRKSQVDTHVEIRVVHHNTNAREGLCSDVTGLRLTGKLNLFVFWTKNPSKTEKSREDGVKGLELNYSRNGCAQQPTHQ
jgi:hypothetical protein